MKSLPPVTVIMPTYNRAYIIKSAIKSVLDQTYKDWELIIIDDGSTDDTEKVICGIGDDRIIYKKQDN
jgi:glycosyltransferase involved in cell wall biosynthesis